LKRLVIETPVVEAPVIEAPATETAAIEIAAPALAEAAAPAPILSPVIVPDPAVEKLRAEITTMEARIIDLEAQKADMDQRLDEFAFQQFQALGELLAEHLRLNHEVCQQRAEGSSDPADIEAAARAAAEYAAFQADRDAPAAPAAELPESDREELKALYRAAAMRCHPDRVDSAGQPEAHAMFLRVQTAYRQRDLETLRQISRQLAAGELSSATGERNTSLDQLEAWLESLLDKGTTLLLAIQTGKMAPRYRLASNPDSWDEHFASIRESLDRDCRALKRELGPLLKPSHSVCATKLAEHLDFDPAHPQSCHFGLLERICGFSSVQNFHARR
jgi:hypothetical protein